MCSQDRKYFRFRYRVIFVAFLLISPTASSAPKQDSPSPLSASAECAAIVSALIKDPHWFLKKTDEMSTTIGQKCIQSIPYILEMMKQTQTPILGSGLLVVSGYLLYESYQLYERTKSLEQNLEKYSEEFKLLEEEFAIINDYINKDIEPHWRNGNTVKMVRNLKIVIEKMVSFVDRLNESAGRIRNDIKRGSEDKVRFFGYGIAGGIVCFCSLFTGYPLLFTPTCFAGVLIVYFNYESYISLQETLEKSKVVIKDIMEKRKEITLIRTKLEVEKMRVE